MKALIYIQIILISFLLNASEVQNQYKVKSKEEMKKSVTEMQYKVTQEGDTETPFKNEYWDNKEVGIYVDINSGEPLFSSLDKYDSGTGWPSFTKSINQENIAQFKDFNLGTARTEVKSKKSNSHLGHVFDDGPKDKGGKRFCINSAALKFIPINKMESMGYGKLLVLFDGVQSIAKATSKNQVIYLGGGCFWGVQDILRKFPGIVKTEVGFSGGSLKNPSYDIVKLGKSGHAEVVKVEFDPQKAKLEDILYYFFRLHDPTTKNQQGNDVGPQYRSIILYTNESQRLIAQRTIEQVDKSKKWKKPLVTELRPFTEFTRAEEAHQDYLVKNPNGYTCHFLRE